MSKCWVIVADTERARLFRRIEPPEFREFEEFESIVNADEDRQMRSPSLDGDGCLSIRTPFSRNPFARPLENNEQSQKAFAQAIGIRLMKARLNGDFDHIHIVASPKLLGQLWQSLDSATRELVDSETATDTSRLDWPTIRKCLPIQG